MSSIKNTADQLAADASVLHQIIHGDENADIPTDSGLQPSIKKSIEAGVQSAVDSVANISLQELQTAKATAETKATEATTAATTATTKASEAEEAATTATTAKSVAVAAFQEYGEPTAWAADTAYTKDAAMITVGNLFYVPTETHTSGGSFSADLIAGKWRLHQGLDVKTGVGRVDTFADLRAKEPAYSNQTVSLSQDGISQIFTAVFGSNLSDDGVNIAVTPTGARWTAVDTLVTLQNGGKSQALSVRLSKYVQTSDYIDDGDLDAGSKINQLLVDISTSATKLGNRELVIDQNFLLNQTVVIPSDMRVIFDGDGHLDVDLNTRTAMQAREEVPETLYPLTADGMYGSDRIRVGANAGLFGRGNIIWIYDTTPITTSPNTHDLEQAQIAKVIKVEGEYLILDCVLEYAFSYTTTSVGKFNPLKNIRVDNASIGSPDYQSGRGIDCRYVYGLKINDAEIGYSRAEPDYNEAYQRQNFNSVTLVGCTETEVNRLSGDQVAWYLLGVDGACRNLSAKTLRSNYVRHVMSLNWNGPGESIHVLGDDLIGNNTTYGAMDTHDVGRDITFRKIRCKGAKYDGGQIRTSNTLVDDYVATHCGKSGFVVFCDDQTKVSQLKNVRLKNFRCEDNAKRGIQSVAVISIDGAEIRRNGDVYNITDNGGIALPGGHIQNAEIMDNNGAAITYFDFTMHTENEGPLTVRDVKAPASASQNTFMYSSKTYENRDLKMRDVRATGYTTANLYARANSTYIADIDDRGCKYGASPTKGVANLSAGAVTIACDSVRQPGSIAARNWFTTVKLQRMTSSVNAGELTVTLDDGVGFTIASSNAADDSKIQWEIE